MKSRTLIRDLLLGGFILVLLVIAVSYQNRRLKGAKQVWAKFEQKTKLPPSDILKIVTLGYDNIYADWLWLKSIQAFGMGWITEDGTTEPIYQYFDTLTDIDPHFISAYRFANMIIGDNRQDWERAADILRKGIYKNPNDYQLPYLGLYDAIWQSNNNTDARWFAHMLQRTDAPNFMKRLQEYIERREGRFEVAYEYNVRYLLEYKSQGNDVESDIIVKRMQNLLDSWYRREMLSSIILYVDEHDKHPSQYEELLDPAIRPDFEAPTMSGFMNAIDSHGLEISQTRADEVSEELVAAIIDESKSRIVGLPPEPFGTWYFIHGPTRHVKGFFAENGEVHYLVAARQLLEMTNARAIMAQTFILDYYKEHQEKPTQAILWNQGLLGRDPLGGHYVYDPDAEESPKYGVFYSTAARRISEGTAMRLGLKGPGPFPTTIEPRLSDYPVDRVWGIANGFIQPDGEELWSSPMHEPPSQENDEEVPGPEGP